MKARRRNPAHGHSAGVPVGVAQGLVHVVDGHALEVLVENESHRESEREVGVRSGVGPSWSRDPLSRAEKIQVQEVQAQDWLCVEREPPARTSPCKP